MAASGERTPRRGPAPIASFDHDVSDESSPDTKQTFRLPEIRENGAAAAALAPPEPRARSHSTPGPAGVAGAAGGAGLTTGAPRIDISRASSSSHHDSRDSSPELPELALLAGSADRAADHLGFKEDGALDLRSSTEELAFLEQTAPAPAQPAARRHSRKDSQGSEAALLAISGRTSRISSVGSQCSAHSALSGLSHASHAAGRVSRLSVASGASRSPSPHKMLLETSFCGPKPIETDPEICAAAVEERLLEIAKLQAFPAAAVAPDPAAPPPPGDARDRREVRTEVTLEAAPAPLVSVTPAPPAPRDKPRPPARPDERRARSRERRGDRDRPEVYKNRNRSKDVIRIKLKPDNEYDDDDDDEEVSERTLVGGAGGDDAGARKPESLALRSPSPAPAPPSRKSSFCSLFKSRETIASPDSPSDALRRKKSLNEGRSRSKSRERTAAVAVAAPGGKLRGSVLSLFRTPRRSVASPSPSSRAASPSAPAAAPGVPPPAALRGLKYYDEARDGIIHIPLRTPPDEPAEVERREPVRPASAPCARAPTAKPTERTVLPDGSIIIPLHSPTEREPPRDELATAPAEPAPSPPAAAPLSPPAVDPAAVAEEPAHTETRARRKERLVFTTHVGSAEQVFSTQLSITKTPSVTSDISASVPSLEERVLRDTHITSDPEPSAAPPTAPYAHPATYPHPHIEREMSSLTVNDMEAEPGGAESPGGSGGGGARDSSESEGSAEAAAARGSDAEQRGLVVQDTISQPDRQPALPSTEVDANDDASEALESFEELPYVPTTLPQERSLALPMLPVRERGPQLQTTASVERPRSVRSASLAAPPPPPPVGWLPLAPPPAAPGAPPPPGWKPQLPLAPPPPPPPREPRLTIKLPRRASAASAAPAAALAPAAPATPADVVGRRSRARSTGDGALPTATAAGGSRGGGDSGSGSGRKAEWIDFSEVPERRPAARRITTLPARAAAAEPAPALTYVEPEHCRCECHRAAASTDSTDPHRSEDEEAGAAEATRHSPRS